MKEGPKMNYSRQGHSCATMRLNNKIFIVVFGGGDFGSAKTEILDTSSTTNEWKFGKQKLPSLPIVKAQLWGAIENFQISNISGPNPPFDFNIYGSTTVTSPTNKGVILIHGSIKHLNKHLMYELSGDSEDNLTWSLLDQKLDTARSSHVSFPIPNDCIP